MALRETQELHVLELLRRDAEAIAAPFQLRFTRIGKTRRDAHLYGCCDTDGNIRIRLRSRVTGDLLRYSSLVATLCHELAHLRHFDHGQEFTRLYRKLLEFARRSGLYCPGPGAPRLRRPPLPGGPVTVAMAASSAPRRRKRRR